MCTLKRVELRSFQNAVMIPRVNILLTMKTKFQMLLIPSRVTLEEVDAWAIIVHLLLNMCHLISKQKWRRLSREPWSAHKFQMKHLCLCSWARTSLSVLTRDPRAPIVQLNIERVPHLWKNQLRSLPADRAKWTTLSHKSLYINSKRFTASSCARNPSLSLFKAKMNMCLHLKTGLMFRLAIPFWWARTSLETLNLRPSLPSWKPNSSVFSTKKVVPESVKKLDKSLLMTTSTRWWAISMATIWRSTSLLQED